MNAWFVRFLLVFSCILPAAGWAQSVSGNGVVQSIQESQESSKTGNVVGAVGGAVIGGLIGNSIGGGSGRAIATGVGVVGGAVVGKSVGGKMSQQAVWYVTIRFDDGIERRVRVEQSPSYRPGDRVRVADNVIEKITR